MKIEPTPLDELFIDGFTNDQIYHQLDLRASVISSLVEKLVDASDATDIPEDDDDDDDESDDSINNNIEDEEDIDLDNLSPEEIQALKDEGLLDDDEDDDDDEEEDSDEESESEDDDDPTIGEISYQQLNDVGGTAIVRMMRMIQPPPSKKRLKRMFGAWMMLSFL